MNYRLQIVAGEVFSFITDPNLDGKVEARQRRVRKIGSDVLGRQYADNDFLYFNEEQLAEFELAVVWEHRQAREIAKRATEKTSTRQPAIGDVYVHTHGGVKERVLMPPNVAREATLVEDDAGRTYDVSAKVMWARELVLTYAELGRRPEANERFVYSGPEGHWYLACGGVYRALEHIDLSNGRARDAPHEQFYAAYGGGLVGLVALSHARPFGPREKA